jgi:hypothetical protein
MPESFEDIENENETSIELNADEQKELEAAMPKLEQIFDIKNPEQRRDVLYSRLKPLIDMGIITEESVRGNIEAVAQVQEKKDFIKEIVELAKIYFMAMRSDGAEKAMRKIKEAERVAWNAERGRVVVNELLDYELIENPDGRAVKLHVTPVKRSTIRGARELKELVQSGLEKIAKILKNDSSIVAIEGISDIVVRGRRFVEELGFTPVGPITEHEGKKGQRAIMSAADFLSKYGKPENKG